MHDNVDISGEVDQAVQIETDAGDGGGVGTDNHSSAKVNRNDDLKGFEQAVLIDTNVCCRTGNTNTAEVNGTTGDTPSPTGTATESNGHCCNATHVNIPHTSAPAPGRGGSRAAPKPQEPAPEGQPERGVDPVLPRAVPGGNRLGRAADGW